MDSLYRTCFKRVISFVERDCDAAPEAACSSVLRWGQILPHSIAEELLRALSDSKALTDDLAAAYIAGFSRNQVPECVATNVMSCLNSISFDNAGTLVTDKVLQSLADNVNKSISIARYLLRNVI